MDVTDVDAAVVVTEWSHIHELQFEDVRDAMRTPLIVELDKSFRFSTDQTTFRLKTRDAGSPARSTTLTDRQGWTMSNCIQLATRS